MAKATRTRNWRRRSVKGKRESEGWWGNARYGVFETDVLAGDDDVSVDGGDDEAGAVAEAGVRIEVPEEHDDGTDLELDIVQR